VARTLARGFSLNEDLAEAISLGHDLGHTPFGHSGERILNRYTPGGFQHQSHSVRVITKLAKNGQGLNLTKEVIDGIGRHSKGRGPIFVKGPGSPMTLEGELVRAADIIAYLAHDLDDALESDLIIADDIPSDLKTVFGSRASTRVGVMVNDLLTNTKVHEDRIEFSFSPSMSESMSRLRAFLDKEVYQHPKLASQLSFGTGCLRYIFVTITESQELYETLPLRHLASSRFQAVCDFIAGMTDRYALNYAQSIANGRLTSKLQDINPDEIPTIVEF
jgi:dGTPase